jgi:hypothetical protein
VERGQHDQNQMAVEDLAPAGRLGTVLGWTLLALGGMCLVAFVFAAFQAQAATNAADKAGLAFQAVVISPHVDRARVSTAYAALLSIEADAQQANVRSSLLMAAVWLLLSISPGVLYASNPHYLGGPLGGLLRRATRNVSQRQSRPWRQIARRQGLGFTFLGVAVAIFFIIEALIKLTDLPFWLVLAAAVLPIPAVFLSISLIGDGAWWFKPRIASQTRRETPAS